MAIRLRRLTFRRIFAWYRISVMPVSSQPPLQRFQERVPFAKLFLCNALFSKLSPSRTDSTAEVRARFAETERYIVISVLYSYFPLVRLFMFTANRVSSGWAVRRSEVERYDCSMFSLKRS